MFRTQRLLLVVGFGLGLFMLPALGGAAARADDPKPDEPPPANTDETRGYVGYSARLIESLTADERKKENIEHEHGLYVAFVTLGSPAQKAGLKAGDVLVKVNGQDVPDTSKVDVKDQEAVNKYMKEQFGKIVTAVKPGDTVTIVVDRAGRTETLKAVAVTKAEMEKLTDEAEREAQAVKVPDPQTAGSSSAGSASFEGLEEGKLRPDDLLDVLGYSEVIEEDGKTPVNHVLRVHTEIPGPRELTLQTGPGRAYGDATITTRFCLLGGEKSASGGIAFRVKDRKNFYVACADGVSKTFQILVVQDDKPRVLQSVEITSPKLRSWHTIEVTFTGNKLAAVFDGATKLATEDTTLSHGWAGMYVNQDADTAFDDWKATPSGK